MSTISEKTNELFMASSLSDDDLGYPSEVSFVPGDQEWADDVVWRNLIEGHPTVLVDEETELLLIPPPDRPVAWMRPRARHPPPPRAHRRIRDLQHPGASPRARDARARGCVGPKEQRHDRHDQARHPGGPSKGSIQGSVLSKSQRT